MYTWERPKKIESLAKMAETLSLNNVSAKDKEDVGGRGLGLQRGGRPFTWRWKSKGLINTYLLAL